MDEENLSGEHEWNAKLKQYTMVEEMQEAKAYRRGLVDPLYRVSVALLGNDPEMIKHKEEVVKKKLKIKEMIANDPKWMMKEENVHLYRFYEDKMRYSTQECVMESKFESLDIKIATDAAYPEAAAQKKRWERICVILHEHAVKEAELEDDVLSESQQHESFRDKWKAANEMVFVFFFFFSLTLSTEKDI